MNSIKVLYSSMFLAILIILIFSFLCPKYYFIAVGLSLVISLVMFFVIFKLESKTLQKETILKKEIIKSNYIDSLTNLPNRYKFFEDLPKAKGIVLIDLDDFSLINSVYSKDVGDEFLKKLSAKLIQSNCVDNNLYRMGGDEFSILVKEDTNLNEIAKCILSLIEGFYIKKDNILIQLTATIAISYKKPFLETADLALKYGKKNKLNLVLYSDNLNMYEETENFLDTVLRIKKALKTNNIVPFFQCIKDKDEKIVKYEALMRIKEKNKYLVPAMFLDIAKKTKLYNELTIQMLDKTFKYMKDKNVPFSINISYDDIINNRIYKFILDKISDFPKPENIIIELLETEAISQFGYINRFIFDVKSKGAKIAIDDFGSGYSNFIYLEKLNPDYIKIDGEIVSKVLNSENASFLVRTIVDFCKKNNIISIAEYVSHRELYLTLKEMGVDEFQGFYFCKPEEKI